MLAGMLAAWTLAAELDLRGAARSPPSAALREAIVDRPQFVITRIERPRRQRATSPSRSARPPSSRLPVSASSSTSRRCATGWRRWPRSSARGCGRSPGGVLEIRAIERMPVGGLALEADGLQLLDQHGVRVAEVDSRLRRPDLPLIAGDGAAATCPRRWRCSPRRGPVVDAHPRAGARGRAALGPGARPRPGDPAARGGPGRRRCAG